MSILSLSRFVWQHPDTTNRVALPGEEDNIISVPVRTLDEVSRARVPNVLKIDVEGHELSVLRGGATTLESDDLKAVILETNGLGAQFGISADDILGIMAGRVLCLNL